MNKEEPLYYDYPAHFLTGHFEGYEGGLGWVSIGSICGQPTYSGSYVWEVVNCPECLKLKPKEK